MGVLAAAGEVFPLSVRYGSTEQRVANVLSNNAR